MIDHASLVFICLSTLKSIIGFFLHLLSFEFVVLVHPFSHLLEALVFGSILQYDGLSLCLHLGSK